MLAIIGFVMLPICVFGIYIIHGGNIAPILAALPFEFGMIGGAAVAAFLISNDGHTIKHALGDLRKVFSGTKFKKSDYRDLLCLLYSLVRLARSKGPNAIEAHIERPSESTAFQAYPRILADSLAVSLICDYMRMMTMNQNDPHQVEAMLEQELEKVHEENMHVAHAFQSMADALPALGIVAAVLGVIKTMASINEPPAVLGGMIGGALVGTFLGVFLAYGIVGPIAARLRSVFQEEAKFYQTIKAVLVAHLHNQAPQISIETGRKSLPSVVMPSFAEIEEAMEQVKAL
ncbi:MAG: flagellar motor stator protein MotA [Alphaproteobacteria bacterium]